MAEMGRREVLISSGLSPSRKSKDITVTIQANESGFIDLSRLQLSGMFMPAKASSDKACLGILGSTVVKKIVIYNTNDLLQGQGDAVAPAAVFSPLRQYGAIQLGQWNFDTASTIQLTLDCHHEGDGYYMFSAAAPFEPSHPQTYPNAERPNGRRSSYVGAKKEYRVTSHPLAAGQGGSSGLTVYRHILEVKFSQHGVVDLNSLQLSDILGGITGGHSSGLETVFVSSILLPSANQLVVGAVAGKEGMGDLLRAPAAIFADSERRFNWLNFGWMDVANNSAIQIVLETLTSKGTKTDEKTDEKADEKADEKTGNRFSAGFHFFTRG